MTDLKSRMAEKIPAWRTAAGDLLRRHSRTIVSNISLEQLYKGLRGVNAVVCDTSFVDPQAGLYIRGIPVTELADSSAEEILYLLCTGERPKPGARESVQQDLARRRTVPAYVWESLEILPDDTHPMSVLSAAMLIMQRESVFVSRYQEGMQRKAYWEATLEDGLNIIARLPVIAAGIYRTKIRKLPRIPADDRLGFSENFAHMLGLDVNAETLFSFMRKFVVVHSDHEGANASVLTARVVDSTLSDLYYSISGAMNCLAGPLHGLANQESVKFAAAIEREFAGVPNNAELEKFIRGHLEAGKVVPGFGHAVLRSRDPRYEILHSFGKEICGETTLFRIVEKLGEVVPPLLIEAGRAKNPNPNIDGITGAMLYHFGIHDLRYYTVMFSTAQILGICAQLIINRAMLSPIIRPRSVTTNWLESFVTDAI